MALIIHKVLFEKLAHHPEWLQFKEFFRTLSGYEVELLEKRPAGNERLLASNIDLRGVLVGVLVARSGHHGKAHDSACQHFLRMAAERFASLLSESHVQDHKRLSAVVVKTCRWIRTRATQQELRLTEAAAACGLSASHLSRLFHQSTGLTFQEYVRRFRLERACELLEQTDLDITRIAFDAGFQSISQFHRSFRAVYGERPTQYRRRYLQAAAREV